MAFVEEISLKARMRTVGVLALLALLPSFGLAAFDDLVAVTVGTQHGYAYCSCQQHGTHGGKVQIYNMTQTVMQSVPQEHAGQKAWRLGACPSRGL
jgi:hypothetical protein